MDTAIRHGMVLSIIVRASKVMAEISKVSDVLDPGFTAVIEA